YFFQDAVEPFVGVQGGAAGWSGALNCSAHIRRRTALYRGDHLGLLFGWGFGEDIKLSAFVGYLGHTANRVANFGSNVLRLLDCALRKPGLGGGIGSERNGRRICGRFISPARAASFVDISRRCRR